VGAAAVDRQPRRHPRQSLRSASSPGCPATGLR